MKAAENNVITRKHKSCKNNTRICLKACCWLWSCTNMLILYANKMPKQRPCPLEYNKKMDQDLKKQRRMRIREPKGWFLLGLRTHIHQRIKKIKGWHIMESYSIQKESHLVLWPTIKLKKKNNSSTNDSGSKPKHRICS